MTTFKYILRDMGRLLIHHWVLGLLTLITASVMLWILELTTLFSFNIRTFLSQLESELVVQVFLKKDSEVERVAESIRAIPSVADLQTFHFLGRNAQEAFAARAGILQGQCKILLDFTTIH